MKKVIGLSIVLLIFVALNSCSTNSPANSNNSNSNGRLSKITILFDDPFNGIGEINFSYDNNGRIIKKITNVSLDSGQYTVTSNIIRNSTGLISYISNPWNDGSNSNITVYSDALGHYTTSIEINTDNLDTTIRTYSYTGNRITEMITTQSYSSKKKDIISYDASGNIVKKDRFFYSGTGWNYSSSITANYDSKINPLMEGNDFFLFGDFTTDCGFGPGLNNIISATDGSSQYPDNASYTYTYNNDNTPSKLIINRNYYTNTPTISTTTINYYY